MASSHVDNDQNWLMPTPKIAEPIQPPSNRTGDAQQERCQPAPALRSRLDRLGDRTGNEAKDGPTNNSHVFLLPKCCGTISVPLVMIS